MKKSPPKPHRLIAVLIGFAIFMGLQFLMNWRLSRSMALVVENNAQMIDDMGQTKQFVTGFGADLNEVRRLLLMPTKDYHFDSLLDDTDTEAAEVAEDPAVMIFKAIEHLGQEETYKARYSQNKTDLEAYLNATETLNFLKGKGFYLRSGLKHEIINEQGTPRLIIDYLESGNLRITRHDGMEIPFKDSTSFDEFKESFVAMVNKTAPADDQAPPSSDNTDNAINPFQEKIDHARATIDALKDDQGFQSALRKAHLQFNFDLRETDRAFEYDISNAEGIPIQILYISKDTGELMMRDPNSEGGSLLNSVINTEREMLVLPSVLNLTADPNENTRGFNILISGKNATNVDTIMLANINPEHKKITLVSIPRDLYYNGRKINSIYANYGMKEMVRQLSDITGQKIDRYILVDMYVFADLIDLVGGVTVTLENDLIDPTYKVMENGEKKTLFYAAGEHTINGTEALRIARSRYTTSDYSRAERQQIILDGLLYKARALGFGDAPTVLKLIKTVLQKTDTDLTLEEAARYYFKYQNYTLDRGSVLSSGNVLESVPIPVDNIVTSLKVNVCHAVNGQDVCEIKSAIYTLQPREKNWDYIKWYIREVFR